MKAGSADDEGYVPEELLPAGILDKDADVMAKERAGKRDIGNAKNEQKEAPRGVAGILKAKGINLNAAPDEEVNEVQNRIQNKAENGVEVPVNQAKKEAANANQKNAVNGANKANAAKNIPVEDEKIK